MFKGLGQSTAFLLGRWPDYPLRLCFAMIPPVVRNGQEVDHGHYRTAGPSCRPFTLDSGGVTAARRRTSRSEENR